MKSFNINARTVVAPIAALTMASLLYVYSRTSIRAAKRNAQKHREADGGQISWRNESLRRHGALERPVDQEPIRQLFSGVDDKAAKVIKVFGSDGARTEAEEKLLAKKTKRREGGT
ncbi:hypothetical protein LPUS_11789 [Lasallia pustulata]|uniref:Uncharacterized protein n=1 Tax=Lasallia pustulata TaxID=136370 RepID=A0A1W5DD06_9LECA|nr:hypothetical protein LPUS_11789 [Lasallia pustulata]